MGTTLYLMVGLPCSGKSTFAKKLSEETGAVRFTPDEWQLRLFGDDFKNSDHDRRHSEIELIMWELAQKLLEKGVSVILDYGFWGKGERDGLKGEAQRLGAACKIYFMDTPLEEIKSRLELRNAQPHQYDLPFEVVKDWHDNLFQKPDEEELR